VTEARRRLLLILLAFLIVGHLCTLAIDEVELWPFSNYSLYTESRNPDQAEQYVLVGVVAGAAPIELVLFERSEYIRPHYRATHHGTFGRYANAPALLERAAADCLRLYEARRLRGLHTGPPLAAARVYLYTWRYAVVDPITRAPTERRLLAEARLASPRITP
jgi:hypothetical protein